MFFKFRSTIIFPPSYFACIICCTYYIDIGIKLIKDSSGAFLEISFKNSGEGFSTENISQPDNSFSGHGMIIVQSLCEEVSYSENGTRLSVIYRLI